MSSPIFVLSPSAPHHHGFYRQRHQGYTQSPRDRYLAALAEAKAAEQEYLGSVARERAIQRQREEEERRRRQLLALQRQREIERERERRQLLADALFNSSPVGSYYGLEPEFELGNREYLYAPARHRHHPRRFSAYDPIENGHVFLRRDTAPSEYLRLASLRQQQEQQAREQAEAHKVIAAAHRRSQLGNNCCRLPQSEQLARKPSQFKRTPQVQTAEDNEKNDLETILKLLFGGPATNIPKETEKKAEAKKVTSQTPTTSTGPLKDNLQSRLFNEPEPAVAETIEGLLSSLFGVPVQVEEGAKLERKPRVEKRNSVPEPNSSTTAAPAKDSVLPKEKAELSLKEQLEARLYSDPNVEIHDTIRAIIDSLAQPIPVPAPKTKPATASSKSELVPEGKGKTKVSSQSSDTTEAPSSPTSKDVLASLNAIQNIEAAFDTLRSDFTFPTHLDFTPPSSVPSSPVSEYSSLSSSLSTKLAYTANNAPLRYYHSSLLGLLTQLDAIESWGNEEVRRHRKMIVSRVEGELETIEKEVESREVQRAAREAARVKEEANNVREIKVPVVDATGDAMPAPEVKEDTATEVAEGAVAETQVDVATAPDAKVESGAKIEVTAAPGAEVKEGSTTAVETVVETEVDVAPTPEAKVGSGAVTEVATVPGIELEEVPNALPEIVQLKLDSEPSTEIVQLKLDSEPSTEIVLESRSPIQAVQPEEVSPTSNSTPAEPAPAEETPDTVEPSTVEDVPVPTIETTISEEVTPTSSTYISALEPGSAYPLGGSEVTITPSVADLPAAAPSEDDQVPAVEVEVNSQSSEPSSESKETEEIKEVNCPQEPQSTYPPIPRSSYPPAPIIPAAPLAPVVAEPSSPTPSATPSESEPVDTFLLPNSSPVVPKRPAFEEDELIVVDKEDKEHSEAGSDWSEVEA